MHHFDKETASQKAFNAEHVWGPYMHGSAANSACLGAQHCVVNSNPGQVLPVVN